jgi:hypothetical protein
MQRREFLTAGLAAPVAAALSAEAAEPSATGGKDGAEPRPVEQRLIMALWTLADLCQEFFDSTCAGCECPARPGWCWECEDIDGLYYQVRLFASMLESNIVSFPEMKERRYREYLERHAKGVQS